MSELIIPLKPLNDIDFALIAQAHELVQRGDRIFPDRHRIGAILLAENGMTFEGVCTQAEFVKPAGVCAERIALGSWATSAVHSKIVAVAAVRKPRNSEPGQSISVVASCGICREELSDYNPQMDLIVPTSEGLCKIKVIDSLPFKYKSVPRES